MAVSILHHRRLRSAHLAEQVPTPALGLVLLAPALDLLGMLQGAQALLAPAATVACGVAAVVLAGVSLHRPRGAVLAAVVTLLASLALRLSGMAEAPVLSLLAIVALGTDGCFGSASIAATEAAELIETTPRAEAAQAVESEALRPAA